MLLPSVFQALAAINIVSKHVDRKRKEAMQMQQRENRIVFLVTNLSFLASS